MRSHGENPQEKRRNPGQETERSEVMLAEEFLQVTLPINGIECPLLVEPRWSLLYVIRESIGLTGTKPGCDRGECGACTHIFRAVE